MRKGFLKMGRKSCRGSESKVHGSHGSVSSLDQLAAATTATTAAAAAIATATSTTTTAATAAHADAHEARREFGLARHFFVLTRRQAFDRQSNPINVHLKE